MIFVYIIAGVIVIGAIYLGVRKFFKTYLKFRGEMVVTCPETRKPAGVEVNARKAAISDTLGERHLILKDCTRWPEREDCGQQCLSQIEHAPENCLVRTRLTSWYADKKCAYCHRPFTEINWYDHKPALMNPDGKLVEWSEVPAEHIPEVLKTHRPVCWNCFIAESFRKAHPELVVDRKWEHNEFV